MPTTKPTTKQTKATPTEQALQFTAPVQITAAASDQADGPKLPRLSAVAYTGKPMTVNELPFPVIVRMSGIKTGRRSRPWLRDHDPRSIVGHTTRLAVVDGALLAEGLGSGPGAAEVLAMADNGYPWQVSINARGPVTFVERGKLARVNGSEWPGPLYVMGEAAISEISIVALGADDDTSLSIAATAAEENTMDPTKATPSAPADNAAPAHDPTPDNAAPTTNTTTVTAAAPPQSPATPPTASPEVIAQIRAEAVRVQQITTICAAAPEIRDRAIGEGWTADQAELAVLRARYVRDQGDARVGAPAVITGTPSVTRDVITAAAVIGPGQVNEDRAVKLYGEQTVQAARRYRRCSLREFVALACMVDGIAPPQPGDSDEATIRAAFSSTTFTHLLSDSANKVMMDAYQSVAPVARRLFGKLNARNFQQHKKVRLTGDLLFKPLANGGELKQGTLAEDSYTYVIDTSGRLIGITRQEWIDDDLGAFTELPRLYGLGAGLTIENAAFATLLANPGNFFHTTNNKNYITGTDTALSAASLGVAVQKMREQKNSQGQPIAIQPRYLLVPPALEVAAESLYKSELIVMSGGSNVTTAPNANVHRSRYEPVVAPHLMDHPKAWYLFADPNLAPAFGIAYLRGVEEPIVEEVTPAPQYVGRCWRGIIDFGIAAIDPKAAVKAKGEN